MLSPSVVLPRVRTLLQILLAVLALGLYSPEPACALGASDHATTCCCTGNSAGKCHSSQPCQPACAFGQEHAPDKQVPARTASVPAAAILALFAFTSPDHSLFLSPVRELKAVPLFAASPPQSRLCLWRI